MQIASFRKSNGKKSSFIRGMPILLLTTTGRKTHEEHTTPVMYIRDGENYVITASNNGRKGNPAWYYNLLATPQISIEVPGKRLNVTASIVAPIDRERLWQQLVTRAPFFGNYQKGTNRQIPMVWLKPNL
jgi:deazaflavin-dependent oxidoreductase (nitroreductase family)